MQDHLKAFLTEQNGLMPAFRPLTFNVRFVMESMRRNMLALTHTQQATLETAQILAQRQSKILSQTIESQLALARAFLSEGTPEEKIINNADMLQNFYTRTVSNMRETSEMLCKSSYANMDILNARVIAGLDEVKSSVKAPVKSNVTQLRKAA